MTVLTLQAKRKRVAAAVVSSSAANNNNSSNPNQPAPSAPPLEELTRKRQSVASPDAVTSDLPKQTSAPTKRTASKDKPDKVAQENGAAKKKPSAQQQLPLHLQQQQQQRKKKEASAKAEKESSGSAKAPVSKPLAKPVVIGSADPKSKVRSWLLASHCRVDAPSVGLPKSKSSPMNLQANPVANLPPRPSGPSSRNNTRSVNAFEVNLIFLLFTSLKCNLD